MEISAFRENIHVPWILSAFCGNINVMWILSAFRGYICSLWILSAFHGYCPHFVNTIGIGHIQVPWLASMATFRPPLNAGSMALGSTSCRGQRHRVGTGEERGKKRQG